MTARNKQIAYTIEFETTASYSKSAGISPISTMEALVRSVSARIKEDPGELVRVSIVIAPDANTLVPPGGDVPEEEGKK